MVEVAQSPKTGEIAVNRHGLVKITAKIPPKRHGNTGINSYAMEGGYGGSPKPAL
jgi:hypothetical protein